MRHLLPAAALVLLAGCGGTPTPVATPARVALPERSERGDLIGLDAGTLSARLGTPRLRVREGEGTKLQFARGTCILDAYLYPAPGGGSARVAHIDTRNHDGRPVDQVDCVGQFETP
jgi:hypothetical protein